MRVDRTNVESLKAYRERLMLALENADYLSPVRAYEKALERCNREIRALAEGRVVRCNGGMSLGDPAP